MSTLQGGGAYSMPPQINFGWISQAWELFRAQMGTWIVALLLYFVIVLAVGTPLAFVTGYAGQFQGIFNHNTDYPPAGPGGAFAHLGGNLVFSALLQAIQVVFLGGLYRMALRQSRGETISSTDIFSAFDVALPLLITGIITGIVTSLGFFLCVFPGFVVAGLLMFAPLLIVDRGLGPIPALSESMNLLKSQWLMAAVFYFVAALIGGLGALVCGVGALFTYPLMFLSIALGYLTFTQQLPPSSPGYGTAQPGVWPPPPSMTPPSDPPTAV